MRISSGTNEFMNCRGWFFFQLITVITISLQIKKKENFTHLLEGSAMPKIMKAKYISQIWWGEAQTCHNENRRQMFMINAHIGLAEGASFLQEVSMQNAGKHHS